jgi:hypothetical protein
MLEAKESMGTLAVRDLSGARRFYEGILRYGQRQRYRGTTIPKIVPPPWRSRTVACRPCALATRSTM